MLIKKLLLTTASLAISTAAFAQIGQAKKFEIFNTTNYVMVTKAQASNGTNPVEVPIAIPAHSKITIPLYHLNQPEYIRINAFLNSPSPDAGVFFSLDNDGIRGYTATHFSDRWSNKSNIIKLSICDSNYSKDCQFKV